MRTIVLDTNVLLSDPNALLSYPDAQVVIPETVLVELDKLKTSRVDPDLRFKGREVSRIMFELSEQGSLMSGVDLPDGGTLRVVPLESESSMPEGLSPRNSDDRILAVAMQVCAGDCDLTLVTNDLNMLLKAQTLGLKVERHDDGAERSFTKRFLIRPFQRYKTPLLILAIAVAVFAAVIVLIVWGPGAQTPSTGALPEDFRAILSQDQIKFYDALARLDRDPNDAEARLLIANTYFDLREQTGSMEFGTLALKNYETYLAEKPGDVNARADMAAMLFYLGRTDEAIQQVGKVLEVEPDHVRANFNLGIFYWRGRGDLTAAAAQFRKVDALTQGADQLSKEINAQVKAYLTQLEKDSASQETTL